MLHARLARSASTASATCCPTTTVEWRTQRPHDATMSVQLLLVRRVVLVDRRLSGVRFRVQRRQMRRSHWRGSSTGRCRAGGTTLGLLQRRCVAMSSSTVRVESMCVVVVGALTVVMVASSTVGDRVQRGWVVSKDGRQLSRSRVVTHSRVSAGSSGCQGRQMSSRTSSRSSTADM